MAINLGPGATLSDAQVQLQQLQQRQAIAAAMEKAGLATGQSPTVDAGVLKVANFGDPITKIINAFAGQNLQSGINQDQADLQKQQSAIQKQGISDYIAQRTGVDNNQPGPPTEAGVGPAPRLTAPDPYAAIKTALSSQDPLLQQMGMSDLASINKGILTPSDIAAHLDGKFTAPSIERFFKTGDKNQLEALPDTEVVNEQVVPKGKAGDYRTRFTAPGPVPNTPPGTPPGQTADTGKVDWAPMGNQTTINLAPHMTEAAFKSADDAVRKGYDTYNTNISNLQNISTAQTALQDISQKQLGPLSDYQQYANSLGAKFGFNVPQAASVQALNAALGENLINVIRKFAPVSDTDAAKANAIVGSTGNIKEALSVLLNQQARSIGTSMDQYQRLVHSTSNYFANPDEGDRYRQTWFPDFNVNSAYTPLRNPQGQPNADASALGGDQAAPQPNVKNFSDLPK